MSHNPADLVQGHAAGAAGGASGAERIRRETVRFRAAEMFDRGLAPSEVAAALGVTERSVYLWRRAWSAGGISALASKGRTGSRCRLASNQLALLAAELDRGALAHGYETDGWTLMRVAEVIETLFGHRYTQRGVAYLLDRAGLSTRRSSGRLAR